MSDLLEVSDLAKRFGGELSRPLSAHIKGIETLENASDSDLTFLSLEAYERYLSALAKTDASLALVPASKKEELLKLNIKPTLLFVENPSLAFQEMIDFFCKTSPATSFEGIHPTAVVDPSASIGKNVIIGPYVVIEKNAQIGDHTQCHAHVAIGPGARIGSDCHIFSHVSIREGCTLGDRVIIQPGAVIGSCGFGYLTTKEGIHKKLPQHGTVVIEDDVEIGANSTIDRARFKETRIGQGTKIDNLCQVAHNVTIGKANLIVSQTGIAGSTTTGAGCVFAGQSASIGHLKIADRSILAARGAYSKSVETPGGTYNGAPAVPIIEHNKIQAHLRRIPSYAKRIQALERKVEELSKQEA